MDVTYPQSFFWCGLCSTLRARRELCPLHRSVPRDLQTWLPAVERATDHSPRPVEPPHLATSDGAAVARHELSTF